jgi:transposase InsO family protein
MAPGGLVRGLPELEKLEKLCEACLVGKHKCTPFPSQSSRHASRPLELLHGDLCGAIKPPTPSGNQYFLLLVDDFSQYMWVSLMASKDCAAIAIKRIQAASERKSGNKLGALRTDRGGGEFTTLQFQEYCAELGVRRELTTPYSP